MVQTVNSKVINGGGGGGNSWGDLYCLLSHMERVRSVTYIYQHLRSLPSLSVCSNCSTSAQQSSDLAVLFHPPSSFLFKLHYLFLTLLPAKFFF